MFLMIFVLLFAVIKVLAFVVYRPKPEYKQIIEMVRRDFFKWLIKVFWSRELRHCLIMAVRFPNGN